MDLPHVTTFCYCMGLKTGAKVVGVMHLVSALTLMVVCSLFAANAKAFVGTVEDAEDHIYSTWYTISLVVAIVSVVHVLLAATLLISVYKGSTGGLRAWVWLMAALLLGALVFVVVESLMTGLSDSGSEIFLSFLEAVLFFGVLTYCIITVNSYYLMLRSVEDMEGPDKTDY